jgi:ABC transport system ATP-binding/permease protein
MPLLTLDSVSVSFGLLPLLENVFLQVDKGERVSIIGRNGAGKSTLLRIMNGDLPPDNGNVALQPGTRTACLEQDIQLSASRPVFDVVADGLSELGELVKGYHRAAREVAAQGTPAAMARLGALQHELEEKDGWSLEQRVEQILLRLGLPADAMLESLSGGWRRRALLARALVAQPDILLLDEPTNHLDIEAITWLEEFVAGYPGAVVFVTHDRAFLQKLATRIVELDRGRVSSWPVDYQTYLKRKEEWLANEAVQQEKFDAKLAEEEVWIRRGIKARRTRNEGRVRALMAMREDRAARRDQPGSARFQLDSAEQSGRLVFEAKKINKAYGETAVIREFSTRILRGDKIGLIGKNGAGKTTLLRLLLQEIQPDEGTVRRGANVQVAYFDQQRAPLDQEKTLFETIGEGAEIVTVNGRRRHVNGYLKDFLFLPEQANAPVKSLSGGERNRLMLARLLIQPANVFVLDEPTNDLDIETLELLEEQLVEFPGTLLLVSHDRAFLDNVVTSSIVFEGGGRIQEYVGGYADWLRQRPPEALSVPQQGKMQRRPELPVASPQAAPRKKLSYNEQREYDRLPGLIETMEAELKHANEAIAGPDFYREKPEDIQKTIARTEELQNELLEAYTLWDELDSRK